MNLGPKNHAPVTLGTNTASALSLSGQQLSLGDVFVQIAGDTMSGNLTMPNAEQKIIIGTGTASIGATGDESTRITFDGGGVSIQWDNMAEWYMSGSSTPNIELFDAADRTLQVLNSSSGKGNLLVGDDVTIGGALDHNGTTIGFFGVTPATRATTYSVTNLTTDRTYDANATSTAELADVLGTLIADLRTYGLVT